MSAIRKLVSGLWFLAALGLNASASQLEAHPFHTTTAEMEYNADSGRFEVTLKMLASDLEEALTRQRALQTKSDLAHRRTRSPGRVTLDKTPQVKELVAAYLNAHFFLMPSGSSRAEDVTAGQQASVKTDTDVTGNNVVKAPVADGVDEKRPQANALQGKDSHRQSTLHWVGMELSKSSVWLYFELEPHWEGDLLLTNELLFELNAQQINTCTLRTTVSKFSLRTDVRQPQVALPPHTRLR